MLFEYYDLANREVGLGFAERPSAGTTALPGRTGDVIPGGHENRRVAGTTK
jgi:hypothetical protein